MRDKGWMGVSARHVSSLLVFIITAYRWIVSPLLPNACRYHPSCSRYAIEAVEEHGILRGGRLSVGRLLRCTPFGGWGYDPVPAGKKSKRTKEESA